MLTAISLVIPLLSAAPAKDVARARELEARASALQRAGRYQDAEEPLQGAIAIWKKHYGPAHIEVLNDEMNLAVSYRRRGDAALAVEHLERVAKLLAASKDPDADALGRSALNNLGVTYLGLGRLEEARASFEKLLVALEAGPASEERARALDNLANVLLQLDAYGAAETHARRALSEWMALRGKEDRDVAVSMSVVGTVVMLRGRFADARPLLEGALRMEERLLGKEHPVVAECLNLVGMLERVEGRLDLAESHYRRALDIGRKSKLPERHPVVVDALTGLAAVEKARQAAK